MGDKLVQIKIKESDKRFLENEVKNELRSKNKHFKLMDKIPNHVMIQRMIRYWMGWDQIENEDDEFEG